LLLPIRQKKILRTEPRHSSAFFGSAADAHILAKDIFIPGFQLHLFPGKRVVLRIAANHAKTMEHIPMSEFRWTVHRRVGV
jgi:hypothetical protein